MVSVLCTLLIICGFCFLSYVKYGYSIEYTLPISIALKVSLLFIFGILSILKIGFYFILALTVFEYVYSVFLIRKKERLRIIDFWNDGMMIFGLSMIIICWCMYGKMFDSWDEFSHWGDVVKVIATIDDFATNPESCSWFKSYPPGMALFQYLFQKVYLGLGGGGFSEWLTYVAYQMFVVSFMLPHICRMSVEQPWSYILRILVVLITPLLFFSGVFRYLYIDPVLGILFACGMVGIITKPKITRMYIGYESAVCAMLTLAKDAGLFFACMIVLACVLDLLLNRKESERLLGQIRNIAIIIFSVYMPKFLWNYHLKKREISVAFSKKIDIVDFYKVITGQTESYRTQVVECFVSYLKTDCLSFGFMKIPRSVVAILLLAFILFLLVCLKKINLISSTFGIVYIILFFSSFAYILGMLLSYMYKFSEYEAIYCASYIRYISIIYGAIWIMFIFLIFAMMQSERWEYFCMSILVLSVLFVGAYENENIKSNLLRESVEESIAFRQNYVDMTERILTRCDRDKVFLIAQGDTGLDLCVLKFAIRPNIMNNNPWSFGKPIYDGDIYTYDYSPEELISSIKDEKYEFVALYRCSDSFIKQYSSVFASNSIITSGGLYRLNDDGLLEECK